MSINKKFITIALMIFIAAVSRVLPHPYNFTPLVAMALFGGATFEKRWQAYLVPIAAFFLSDLALTATGNIGFYDSSQFFVYGAMLLVAFLGTTLKRPGALKILGYSLSGSAIFWIVSNFGVWFANYASPHSPYHEQGLTLAMTYLRALPFYNQLGKELFFGAFAGDLFYSIVLFGVFAIIQKNSPALRYAKTY